MKLNLTWNSSSSPKNLGPSIQYVHTYYYISVQSLSLLSPHEIVIHARVLIDQIVLAVHTFI